MKIKFGGIALLPITLLLGSCSYGHKNFKQDDSLLQEPNNFVIQFNDSGMMWDPAVAERALKTIAYQSRHKNTIVLLFVHGWHHNAHPNDSNMRDFAKTLAKTQAALQDSPLGEPGPYTQSRTNLTTRSDVNVIGVYVGWRGRSLPGLLDYTTFWGRKKVAETVGKGALYGFLRDLNDIYRERYRARSLSANEPFMGMVTFGHSFGGQVVFKAVSEALEEELQTNSTGPLLGYGDLTVLLNPALEAAQYERIHHFSHQRTYPATQTPLLFVLSSEGDSARKFWFPAARFASYVVGGTRAQGAFGLWGKALGEYKEHHTHRIDVRDDGSVGPRSFNPDDYINRQCHVAGLDLGADREFETVTIKRIRGAAYHPFLVGYTSNKLVTNHNGIFESALRNFLNDFVAITEGKKMIVNRPNLACQEEASASEPR